MLDRHFICSQSTTEQLDSRLGRRTRRRGWDKLTSTTAAERKGAKQRIVERHHVPDGALDRLVPRRPAVRLGDARRAGSDRSKAVEVRQRRVNIGGVDVVGQAAFRLEVGGRDDLMTGRWFGHVITYVSLRSSIQRVDRWLLLLTIPAQSTPTFPSVIIRHRL